MLFPHRDERDLLWKFRHCLTDNKKALTKFLLSVDWSVEQEVAQVHFSIHSAWFVCPQTWHRDTLHWGNKNSIFTAKCTLTSQASAQAQRLRRRLYMSSLCEDSCNYGRSRSVYVECVASM